MKQSKLPDTNSEGMAECATAIGAKLRSARLDAGMKIGDLVQNLRISRDFVKALEAGEFDVLPGPTYVVGYIRSYGAAVAMGSGDVAELIKQYNVGRSHNIAKPTYRFPTADQRAPRSGAIAASIAVLVAVGGYAGWYLMGNAPTEEAELATAQTESALLEIETTMTEGDAPLADQGPSAEGSRQIQTQVSEQTAASAASPAALNPRQDEALSPDVMPESLTSPAGDVATTNVAATNAVPANVTPVDAAPINAGEPADQVASMPVDANPQPMVASATPELEQGPGDTISAIASQRDPSLEITIRAVSPSWVEIVRNDGEEVMTKLMRGGDTYLVTGDEKLYLSTGNAGGLEFVFSDGTVTGVGEVGEIVRDLPLVLDKLKARL
jgi:cytoskeleton protein RodZ